jgi:adenine-specific DNA-methyltransferase
MTRQAGKESVHKLVEDFEKNESQYMSKSFQETEARNRFIDPFFTALGWELNQTGIARKFWDVHREFSQRDNSATKKPDYAFRVKEGAKYRERFFVEAKAPHVDLEGNSPVFQAKRYAFSSHGKTPIVVLTDFQTFRVFNGFEKPVFENPLQGLIKGLDLEYHTYLDTWDTIWDAFSKEAVIGGSIERSAGKMSRNVKSLDDEFLADISAWRETLARNVALRNKNLSADHINEAVQRILDRLIFIRNLEDREIESENTLLSMLNVKGNIYPHLLPLFRRLDGEYNGLLFKEHFSETITVDDPAIKGIIKQLCPPQSPYQFDMIEPEILGRIYERFLGSKIRLTENHQAKVEEKPEVRHAGGVYYTPQYIVDYIVKNTVGVKIKDKTPEEIEAVKICDPACGSGSFLLGAFQYLIEYHCEWYAKADTAAQKKYRDDFFTNAENEIQLTLKKKTEILKNNIFGVDIDREATEVAIMSLYLKILDEGYDKGQAELFLRGHILPDMTGNIKCGNSLIGTDFYDQGNLGLADDSLNKVNCFDWDGKDGFADIFKNGGFDVVIGNPPYVRMQIIDKSQINYFKQYYKGAGYGNYDLYILFIERSLRFLSVDGLYGMILPHKFFQAEYGEGIRKIIAEGKNVVQINNFTTNQVFENATTYTCLLFLSKSPNNNFAYQDINLGNNISDSLNSPVFDTISSSRLSGKWNFNNSIKEDIFDKISQNTILLEQISRKIFKGSSTGNDDVYLVQLVSRHDTYSVVHSTAIDENVKIENDLLKPFIYGQDVRRFFINNATNYVIFPYQIEEKVTLININVLKSDYPLALSYFERVRKILIKRKLEFSSGDFYKYSAGISLSEYSQKKILIPDMLVESRFGIDINGEYYHGPAIHSFVINEQYNYLHYNYVLALLSSKLFWFFISHTSTALRGNAYRLTPEYINPFPVKVIDKNNQSELYAHDNLVSLVDKMLDLKQKEAAEKSDHLKTVVTRQIDSVDKAIDTAVYGLYGLTEDEIKVVEGKKLGL